MKTYKVKKGDCFSSIARQNGFHDANVLYTDSANASLKGQRDNLHILHKGDKVKIPDKESKKMTLAPESSAGISVKGIICELKVVVEDFDGNGFADMAYCLEIGGEKFEGKTDSSGLIETKIDAGSMSAELTIYLDKDKKNSVCWPIDIGGLAPHDEIEGLQARLNNLGYACGNEKGKNDKSTKKAVNAFKKNNGLADDDVIDQATKDKARSVYGF
ncbi:peptidoglycan-binding protein [Agaribacter marinus]|uniref:LysM domain-containing protein n=1 Tax=Agaribacter marinus TaxID=1431249 RepID=A0AA37WI74_9ALTE|nr:peptidoglycan-binding protein [Agaribacter marinus]GLR71896.1 hypothetical protein GCM10007852_28040 [Agaribacter marinus]